MLVRRRKVHLIVGRTTDTNYSVVIQDNGRIHARYQPIHSQVKLLLLKPDQFIANIGLSEQLEPRDAFFSLSSVPTMSCSNKTVRRYQQLSSVVQPLSSQQHHEAVVCVKQCSFIHDPDNAHAIKSKLNFNRAWNLLLGPPLITRTSKKQGHYIILPLHIFCFTNPVVFFRLLFHKFKI
jgi:hypothetical protein